MTEESKRIRAKDNDQGGLSSGQAETLVKNEQVRSVRQSITHAGWPLRPRNACGTSTELPVGLLPWHVQSELLQAYYARACQVLAASTC